MITIGIEAEVLENRSWGMTRNIVQLLKHIASRPELKKEFHFVLFFKSHIPDHEYLNNPIFTKKVIKLPLQPFTSFVLYYYFLLPIYLWFKKVDILFLNNYMLSPLTRTKSIVSMSNDIHHEMHSPHRSALHRIQYRIFSTWAIRHATRLLTWSQASKDDLVRAFHINEDRVAVVPMGTDHVLTHAGTVTHAVPEKFMLYVGQAFPRRHLKELILAFEKIAPEFPDLHLIASGQDKYRPRIIKQLVNQVNTKLGSKRVHHYDFIDGDANLTALYKHATLTVYVSDQEAFGFAPMEGLRQGSIPVIADNALGREQYGDSAFFVSKLHDVDVLATVLHDGLTNQAKRDAILQAGPAIVGRYTWQQYTDKFLTLCKQITQ